MATIKSTVKDVFTATATTIQVVPQVAIALGNTAITTANGLNTIATPVVTMMGDLASAAAQYSGALLDEATADRALSSRINKAKLDYATSEEGSAELEEIGKLHMTNLLAEMRADALSNAPTA